jgi:iron complex transport system ATP-binding protein
VTALLEAEDIMYQHILSGVSLRIEPGEIVGLIGPNAAGKSTLARICCGLLAPTQGRIALQGVSMAALSSKERAKRVAFLPQDPPSDLLFTAREVALMGRAPHLGFWALEGASDLRKAEESLKEASALELAERPISQLSGGERQRVFLARAFAQEAALLILDEPTDGLDLKHQVALIEALKKRAANGGGTLLVLHDLILAGASCDRLILLDRGSIKAAGPPSQVLSAELLGATYGTAVDVVADPATGHPLIAPRITRDKA